MHQTYICIRMDFQLYMRYICYVQQMCKREYILPTTVRRYMLSTSQYLRKYTALHVVYAVSTCHAVFLSV